MQPLRSTCAALAFASLSLAQILPNDGIVGGLDMNVTPNVYRLYAYPGLGTPTPGAATAITYDFALSQRLNHFVIDQANANIIATASSATIGGDVEIWRLDVTGASSSATQLTTLSGTGAVGIIPALDAMAMHRDATGCIVVLCATQLSDKFTVHRLAVTQQSAMAVQVPIANPNQHRLRAIATDPSGQILLGGSVSPASNALGVYHTISMAGGTLGAGTTPIPGAGYHVASLATDALGTPAMGLDPRILPATANYQCGALTYLFQYNAPWPYTTIWLDIELNPAGTQFVLAGVGAAGIGGGGALIRIGAVGCVAGAPQVLPPFAHPVNQVAIAFPSQNYGCGCPPSTNVLPKIGETAPPTLGQVWIATLTNGVPNSTAMMITGRNDKFYLGNPLPQSLSVIGGQTDCFLLNSVLFQFPVHNTDPFGFTQNQRAIPNDPALIGTRLFSEWLVFETTSGIPPFSTAGLISTVQ